LRTAAMMMTVIMAFSFNLIHSSFLHNGSPTNTRLDDAAMVLKTNGTALTRFHPSKHKDQCHLSVKERY
jgi:hypothetical protein